MSDALLVDFRGERRCLSCAVLGGGLRTATHWMNLQVAGDYARVDPGLHLEDEARGRGLDPARVIGMLTAADVRAAEVERRGIARAHATVGISHPLAAAGRRPRALPRTVPHAVPPAGTINILVLVDAPLSDAALAGALQTATEAKAQALADGGVCALNHPGPATGTATDAVCIAALPGGGVPFAGPASVAGAAIAATVHAAVLAGAIAWRTRRHAGADGRRRTSLSNPGAR